MPWATFETGDKFCVFKLDADNNKTGESLECFPTREAAQNYVKGLYSKEKAGARHSSNDNSLIQKAHDVLCELGAKCPEPTRSGPFENTDKISIFKDATGKYRWVSFSSSAFRDRDREIVSTKALVDDVARADSDGKYGPLRFWHEPGLDLGYADFNAMEGRVLVESGGFYDETIAERLKEYQAELGLSIGFTHPADEPDGEGTYHTIRRFERSIVPADKASNLLTQFIVKESGVTMDETKKSLLEKLIGPDLAAKFIGQANTTQKEAEAAGLKFKEAEAPPVEVKAEAEAEKPAALTEEVVKALINKAFDEYAAKQSEAKKESDEATTKATGELSTALKSIQDGQTELKEAVTLALQGVAELNGQLPRKLGEQAQVFRPSQNGATPKREFAEAVNTLKAAHAELAASGDPLAKFTNAIFAGGNQQPFVNPNQPQGN